MKFRTLLLSVYFAAASIGDAATPPPPPSPSIDQQFEQTVKPFVGKYCVACHSGKMAPAQFDLKSYTSVDMVTDDFARWALLAERLKNQEIPPKADAAPARGRSEAGDRLGSSRARGRNKEGRRRPRRSTGAPLEQC